MSFVVFWVKVRQQPFGPRMMSDSQDFIWPALNLYFDQLTRVTLSEA